MDEFDVFNQPSQEVPSAENTNNQENDLFGSMDATNTLDNDNVRKSLHKISYS